jgi:3,4-dihydroxy-2-butanone 4-phosphate synthase
MKSKNKPKRRRPGNVMTIRPMQRGLKERKGYTGWKHKEP